jgi:hypothetical protein
MIQPEKKVFKKNSSPLELANLQTPTPPSANIGRDLSYEKKKLRERKGEGEGG